MNPFTQTAAPELTTTCTRLKTAEIDAGDARGEVFELAVAHLLATLKKKFTLYMIGPRLLTA